MIQKLRFSSIEEREVWWKKYERILSGYPYFACLKTVHSLNEWYGDFERIMGAAWMPVDVSDTSIFDNKRWLLGGFCYSWKAFIEPEQCPNLKPIAISFPDLAFFEPSTIIYVSHQDPLTVFVEGDLPKYTVETPNADASKDFSFKPTIDFETYKEQFEKIHFHLKRGDIYEVNLTQQFDLNEFSIDPISYFEGMTRLSPTHQAVLFRWEDCWVISSSPERFLKKKGHFIVSQPIKGTIRRQPSVASDLQSVQKLFLSSKERAENVMIVDLVRNDLNRCCETATVNVERLYQVQSYKHLHHLVSTIVGHKAPYFSNFEIIKALFPPGSMTGCPKIKAMRIIEAVEAQGRGMYSGAIGYFFEGNFDLNVVIRSLIWDASRNYGNFHVGGAITLASDLHQEYEECLIKADSFIKIHR